jgi:excinuclease ABC subunit B
MQVAINETARRRQTQIAYNLQHNITPLSINKPIRDQLIARDRSTDDQPTNISVTLGKELVDLASLDPSAYTPAERTKLIKQLTKQMQQSALDLDFETAAQLRDSIQLLEKSPLGIEKTSVVRQHRSVSANRKMIP